MCRGGVDGKHRRCEDHWTQSKRDMVNQVRRERYAAQKAGTVRAYTRRTVQPETTGTAKPALVSELSPAQRQYFEKTKAVDSNGEPLKLYHGSSTQFDSFSPDTLGKGNDSWGNGFYFTDQESIASGYAKDSNSPDANVKEFYLNLENPLYVDGKEYMSLNSQEFTKQQALEILKQHPQAYFQPNDDDEMNPLGDYSPNFWDKDEWTKEELDRMWEEVADEHFENPSWPELEGLYGRDHGSAYLHAVHKATGYDGVIVDFGSDGKHYVSWFPEQMKLTSNTDPKNDTTF